MEKLRTAQQQNQRYVVETITMTTVTERRIVREAATIGSTDSGHNSSTTTEPNKPDTVTESTTPIASVDEPPGHQLQHQSSVTSIDAQPLPIERSTYLTAMDGKLSSQIAGILKGGKMWKNEQTQVRVLLVLWNRKVKFLGYHAKGYSIFPMPLIKHSIFVFIVV